MSFGGGGQHGDDEAAPSSSDTEMKEANQVSRRWTVSCSNLHIIPFPRKKYVVLVRGKITGSLSSCECPPSAVWGAAVTEHCWDVESTESRGLFWETQRQRVQAASGASKPAESALKPEPVPEAMDEDSKAAADAKQQAVREKELGNAAYKAKKFDEAIKHYDAAVNLDDTDISFLTNRCGKSR